MSTVKKVIPVAVFLCSFVLSAGCGTPPPPEKMPPAVPAEAAKAKVEPKKAEPVKAEPKKAEPLPPVPPPPAANEKVLYDFENDTQYWQVPEWALEKQDHVARSVAQSKDIARRGAGSLKVAASFPGKTWTTALVEIEEYLDWTPYKRVSCDIYLPPSAPEGLKAKFVLTVGEGWKFVEMTQVAFLIPGKWTTVSASLEKGSTDWKMMVIDDDFRKDIRKVAIRVESNKSPIYDGLFYIDSIRVAE